MKKRSYFFLSTLVISLFGICCNKEITKLTTFSEVMIGKWEMRETINQLEFQDAEWHLLSPPYVSMNLKEDGTYLWASNCTDTIESGSYTISQEDSIVYINTNITKSLDFKQIELTETSFLITYPNFEGALSEKYFKVE